MEPKTKKKKRQIKIHDLKPAKNPKGGLPPGPCGPIPVGDRRPG